MSKKVTYDSDKGGYQTHVIIKSTLIYIALILLTLICLVPIWILVVNATREHNDIISHVSLIPGTHLFANIKTLRTNSLYSGFFSPLVGMRNSLIIAGCCCALTVFFSGMTAYGLVVYDFKLKGPAFVFILTGIFEVIIVGWCFKTSRVLDQINLNTEKFRMPKWWFYLSIKYVSPVVLIGLFAWNVVSLFMGGGIYGAGDGYSLLSNIILGWLIMGLSLISGFIVKGIAKSKKDYKEEDVRWDDIKD